MSYESPILEITTFSLENGVSSPGGNNCGERTGLID